MFFLSIKVCQFFFFSVIIVNMYMDILISVIGAPRPKPLWAAAPAEGTNIHLALSSTEAAKGKTKDDPKDKDAPTEATKGRNIKTEPGQHAHGVILTLCFFGSAVPFLFQLV